jgi:hypothetical protein
MSVMTLDMNDNYIKDVKRLQAIVQATGGMKFMVSDSREKRYEWVGKTLGRFRYVQLSKKDKSIVKRYIAFVTQYSDCQIDRFIREKKEYGTLKVKERTQYTFPRFYESSDIALLAEVANGYHHQNGHALKKVCEEMYHVYGDEKFERLKHISVPHIYNFKKTNIYQSKVLHYTKTQAVSVNIGERKKPQPYGKPGFLRVDSVHQGDLDKEKGVYHINFVDEVTQMQYVGAVERISEYYLQPVLEEILGLFPFVVINFHSDNGSEYINKVVSNLLNKLHIIQTKSRSRKTNDNALVEGKNGAVVRKYMGYIHIPKKYAESINTFYRNYMDDFLNYHRFCAFSTDHVNEKGKIKRKYETYMTPIQKFLSLPHCEQYLKDGVTTDSIIQQQKRFSHLESAQRMRKAKQKLFANFKN